MKQEARYNMSFLLLFSSLLFSSLLFSSLLFSSVLLSYLMFCSVQFCSAVSTIVNVNQATDVFEVFNIVHYFITRNGPITRLLNKLVPSYGIILGIIMLLIGIKNSAFLILSFLFFYSLIKNK
jgi:hypothetical protein